MLSIRVRHLGLVDRPFVPLIGIVSSFISRGTPHLAARETSISEGRKLNIRILPAARNELQLLGSFTCRERYATDNSFRGTPCGSRKKPIAGTSPKARLSTAAMCRGLEKNGMVGAWHGRGMASVNQTRPRCVNQIGKTHSKPLAARHGRETAWTRHAMCESALKRRSRRLDPFLTLRFQFLLCFSPVSEKLSAWSRALSEKLKCLQPVDKKYPRILS
jgi:hypothetical protein